MTDIIYLDYAATTPVDPAVAEAMSGCLTADGCFANPGSAHAPGRAARGLVEQARAQVAGLVGARATEIIWTSGATESDNLAIKGVAWCNREHGRHLVTVRTEHKAVLDTCTRLQQQGFEITYLQPDAHGMLTTDQLAAALRDDTALVSIMHVNNETGVIHDIAALGAVCREHGVLFHVDAAQSAGKIPVNLGKLPVDLMSFSAHKIYGPKGVGALFVRDNVRLRIEPLIHGGGQEHNLRSGTLATHQVVGMGEAFRIAADKLNNEGERLGQLREQLWQGLQQIGDVVLNGHPEHRAPGFLNVCFGGVEGESLRYGLRKLAVSGGSACMSGSQGSYVLRALGRNDQQARASLRFSIGRFTTADDVKRTVEYVANEVQRLRAIAVPTGSG